MRAVGVIAFLGGLLLAVRVMFFGVQRRTSDDHLHHRRWPLALAAFLSSVGAMVYARTGAGVTPAWVGVVVLTGSAAGAGAWWLVKRSAAIPSTDPEDDPRYRFQGHIARVITAIDRNDAGKIAFDFEGQGYQLEARWALTGEEYDEGDLGEVGNEVVIERVESDVAFVEPWTAVEGRL